MNNILTIQLIVRRILSLRTINKQSFHTSSRSMSAKYDSSSSDSDSDDDVNNTKKNILEKSSSQQNENEKPKSSPINNALNELLIKMAQDTSESRTFRAIPQRLKTPKPLVKLTLEEKILTAAKETADSLGGDTEKTRKELLSKVLPVQDSSEKIEKSAKNKAAKEADNQESLSELIASMKVDRTKHTTKVATEFTQLSRTPRIQDLAKRFQERKGRYNISTRMEEKLANLYVANRLNIFDPIKEGVDTTPADTPKMEVWNILKEKEFKLLLTHPPKNILEEMIQWTERGLLWKFPINNEIGLEEEENTHFSEHVFMEQHIKDWCPRKGPISHFMELVCVGLSKNPYMTVEEKLGHLQWYKEYFASKQELLKEIGAIDKDISMDPKQEVKQINP